jgi:sulfite reductase alpha subunit-like flavoprotein
MKNNKIIAIMMTLSMLAAAFAGCLSDNDESNLDEADGGYEYASNVDNHRMLVEDVCDIKDFAVLALGDTAFDLFCESGKEWDQILEDKGGTRVNHRVDCDVDYEDEADNWIPATLEMMKKIE